MKIYYIVLEAIDFLKQNISIILVKKNKFNRFNLESIKTWLKKYIFGPKITQNNFYFS
jgi:hypothetical protein